MTFRRWLFVAVIATAVVAGIAIWTAALWSQADWGAVWGAIGQWVGGAGTVAAVWTALHIARREAAGADDRALHEARDRETRALAAASEQAIQEASLVLIDLKHPEYEHGNEPQWLVTITNHGDQPFLLPRLENFVNPVLGGTASWDFDDPGGLWEAYVAPDTLPAGESDSIPVRVVYEPHPATSAHEFDTGGPRPEPIFAYTDLRGRRWRRVGASVPVQVDNNDSTPVSGPDWYRIAPRRPAPSS